MNKIPVLEVRNISVFFSQYVGAFRKNQLQTIRDLSLTLYEGEIVAVAGASGSGKSLLAHAILGILPYNASLGGEMLYFGQPLTEKRKEQLRGKEIVLVPQSISYLDPLMKVGPQIRKNAKDSVSKERVSRVLNLYGLSAETEKQYPFELSGGMARRVLISTAAMGQPKLVIADEPTPGLHSGAAQSALARFRKIADEGAAVLLITHDLELAAGVADRVVVLYAGMTLEEAPASDFAEEEKLRHPYTRALWRAMPQNGFQAISGMQPDASDVSSGCPFRYSCDSAHGGCAGEIPYYAKNGGYVRCIREVEE